MYATGVPRFDLRDPYHLIATMTWGMFFTVFIGSELLINLLFAVLYAAAPGSVANAAPGSVIDGFFFSIQTLATVGYGVMAPATRYGQVISAIEILVGTVYTAVVTGVVFVRFSKPKAKIIYAARPIVTQHNGIPTLMIRIANGRPTLLTDASVTLGALLSEVTPEGQRFRRLHPLTLSRAQFPMFAITWTLMHALDRDSPLHGCTRESLARDNVRLFLSVQARDAALGAHVHDTKDYLAESVAFGMRYSDAVSWDETGRTSADIRKVSAIEPG